MLEDEPIRRDSSPEKLAALRPAFEPDGPITAGNAPGLSDGASPLVIMSREKAEALGLEVLATIVAQGQYSDEPTCCTSAGPGGAGGPGAAPASRRRTCTWSRSTRRSPR